VLGQVVGGGWQRCGSGSSGCRHSGHLTPECEYLSAEALGDLRGGRIVIRCDLAGDRIINDTASSIQKLTAWAKTSPTLAAYSRRTLVRGSVRDEVIDEPVGGREVSEQPPSSVGLRRNLSPDSGMGPSRRRPHDGSNQSTYTTRWRPPALTACPPAKEIPCCSASACRNEMASTCGRT
jgi:hypothetical protein